MYFEIPNWLHTLAMVALLAAGACVIVIVCDILAGHRQHMWIMNAVWPITALWAGPFALLAYYKMGRRSTHRAMREAKENRESPPAEKIPFSMAVAMQIAMAAGFVTSYPANWWLLRKGIKERM